MAKTVFLGVEGSGKTTLTMALVKAFERHRNDGWYLKPLNRNSFRFLQTLPKVFDGTTFPNQTARLRELSWEIEYNNQTLTDFSVLDYPGEVYRLAFLDEKDEDDPQSFRQLVDANKSEINSLLSAVREAEAVYVLFNLRDVVTLHDNSQDLDAIWLTNECLNLMRKTGMISKVQLLLTQADRYRDAGMNLSELSLDNIPLIGHDQKEIPWQFISVVDSPESEYGIDKLIPRLIAKPLESILLNFNGIDMDNVLIDKFIRVNLACGYYYISINQHYLSKISDMIDEVLKIGATWLGNLITHRYGNTAVKNDWNILLKSLKAVEGKSVPEARATIGECTLQTNWACNIRQKIVAFMVDQVKNNSACFC